MRMPMTRNLYDVRREAVVFLAQGMGRDTGEPSEFDDFVRDSSELRTWPQTWGSTAGPFDRVGASAMMTFTVTVTVTAVPLGPFVTWYLGDRRALTTAIEVTNPDAGAARVAYDGWRDGRMPYQHEIAAAITAWSTP